MATTDSPRAPRRARFPLQTPGLPTATRQTAIAGAAIIAVAFLGFGVWAATTSIASAVVAHAQVIVGSKRKQVQHLTGGVIRELNVNDGDKVSAGAPLVVLENTVVVEQYTRAKDEFFLALATEARLLAELEGAKSPVYPVELTERAAGDKQVQSLIDGQNRILEARDVELRGQLSILEQKKRQLENESAALRAERASAVSQSQLARNELATLDDLLAKGYTTRRQVLIMRREIAQLTGATGRLDAQIARTSNAILESDLNLKQARFRLQTVTQSELRDVQSKIPNLRAQYRAASAMLERTTIRAPVAGTVVASKLTTAGSVIRPGETILEIVPAGDRLMIEAQVSPADVDEVKVGLTTEIRLPGLKQRNAPHLEGRVTFVSADALQDVRTGGSYFVAHIDIPDDQRKRLSDGNQLQPGMPAEILIKTGERTALNYLLSPLSDSISNAWREK